jgi:hypothetical protein
LSKDDVSKATQATLRHPMPGIESENKAAYSVYKSKKQESEDTDE